MSKVGMIIQARNGAKRLPNKMVAQIEGKTLLEHVINRLKHSKYSNNVVLATTEKEEDKILIKIAKKLGILNFAGAEEDVLLRFIQTVNKFNFDIIVRICGDNALIDPKGIDKMVDYLIKNNLDYINNFHENGLPTGAGAEVLTKEALFKENGLTNDAFDREHVTWFIRNHPDLFKIFSLDSPKELVNQKLKFAIDTQEDLEFVRTIYKKFNEKEFIELKDVIKTLNDEPNLITNNAK